MLKTFIAIMAIFVLGITANAETVTLTPTGYNNGTFTCTQEPANSGYKLTAAKNNGGTAPTYNTNNSDARVYAKGSVTVTAPTGVKMTKIVFTLSSQGQARLGGITASTGTIKTQAKGDLTVEWSGEASSVTFTVGDKAIYSNNTGNAQQFCFNKVTITTGSSTKVATPIFTPAAGAVVAGTKVSISSTEGATIYYTTDGTTPTALSTAYSAPIAIEKAMTIKAIAVKEGLENSEVATAAYTITQAPQPGSGMAIYMNSTKTVGQLMSASNMTTVSDIIAPISNDNVSAVAGNNLQGGTQYTQESKSYNSVRIGRYANKTYLGGSLTITLKEAVKITKIEANIKSYKSTNSAAPTAKWNLTINDVAMGEVTTDFTTAVTKTFNYTNTTGTKTIKIETPSGTAPVDLDYIVIYSEPAGPAEPVMSFADAGPIAVDYSVNPEPFTNRMITDSDGKVSYSSSAETVAVVDNDGFVTVKGAGSTVITATVAATDNYKEKSLSYTLNVNKATATLTFKDVPETLKQGETYDLQFTTNLPADLYKDFELEDAYAEGEHAYVTFSFDEATKVWKMKAVDITPIKEDGTNEGTMIGVKFSGNNNWNASEEAVEIITVIENLIQAQCQWSAGTVLAPINDFTAPELQNVPAALNNKILYKSSNEKAITVNENGEIIVRTPGKATITASWSKTFDNTTLKTYEAGEVSTEIVISSLAGYYSPIPVPEISTTGTGDFPLSYSYSDNNGFWYGGYDNTNGGSLTITLTTATEGAQIYYKKTQGPGYDPDKSSVNKVKARAGEDGFTLYSAPIECGGTEQGQLQFYAKTADKQSNTETFQFSIMTGIDGVDADNDSDARWFNLQGVEVKNPANGIYIRVANGKTTKVIR